MPGAGVANVAAWLAGTVPAAPDVTAGAVVAGVEGDEEVDVHPAENTSRTANTAITKGRRVRLIRVIIFQTI